ncbi:unnamed protein product [Psylliodes chrysocephalus]|uniref:GH18 domain-containing protein n=1 Tax=Psylliodes chrysocephalus TaxID=3402493 RepID=A0A9P0CJL3_9CUCU|nr:unnamed protein product [Psylliodes chrysocephala]
MNFILLAGILYALSGVDAQCDDKDLEIVCYWGSWSIYRKDIGHFNTSHINTDICTTVVYSFVGLDINMDITSLDTNADFGSNGGFANFINLKEKNPCLKTVLAIGGWNEGSIKYSVMAATDESRKKFAQSVLQFLVYYKFDGIDIDWEYPTIRGGLSQDGDNFAALLKEIKNKLSPWGLKLSIAVSIDDTLIGVGYKIRDIAKVIDSVNLMAYDYISSDSKVTGLSAPLSDIKTTISKWIDGGLPSKKLILGIPAYAKNFVLDDPNNNGIGAPVAGIGRPGLFTQEDGLLSYYEVLDILNVISDIHVEFSDGTNYAYYDDEWLTYDNEATVKTKISIYNICGTRDYSGRLEQSSLVSSCL